MEDSTYQFITEIEDENATPYDQILPQEDLTLSLSKTLFGLGSTPIIDLTITSANLEFSGS